MSGVAAAHGMFGVPMLGREVSPSSGVGAIRLTLTATGQTSEWHGDVMER